MLAIQERDDPTTPTLPLGEWSCCSHASGSITSPSQLDALPAEWLATSVPGTVAATLESVGRWDMQHPTNIDALDWWYRTSFAGPNPSESNVDQRRWLCFDGLASLAEIWLNGEQLLTTDNAFRRYTIDVTRQLDSNNELVIGFRSVTADLQKKRPRPRWKTNLVGQQQLRWRRTPLLGRIPGWSPPVPAIGPWRAIRLEQASASLTDIHLTTRLEGTTGIVSLSADLSAAVPIDRVLLRVGELECNIEITKGGRADTTGSDVRLSGELRVPDAPLWWPHTHGSQPQLPCRVVLESGSNQFTLHHRSVGFRTLSVCREQGFSLSINGEPIYCRGACWTVSNVFTLDGTEQSLRHDLTLAREAGANMLRVVGTMIYESDTFYRLCDELGILVWQDMMFANMDYPVDDPAFAANIESEATEQLRRLASHPSIVVYCGNSEVEQQAAMLGMPRERWSNPWFAERLPALCAELHPGTTYVPSTPTGGVLPFHPSTGISHFYGVGAYLRPPTELRQAGVKFTPECLGFANLPEPDTINLITEGALPTMHHPKWKQRVPRDTGAGWDFEDVRDHYLKQLFNVDPVMLRSTDMPRYLDLSRVVPGEMMAQTFSEWRSSHSENRGGLVWFFKDLWPAAGWGLIDSTGLPKATYYFLKRTWRNRQIVITDEGLNGLHIHSINESNERWTGSVEVTLWKEPNVIVARKEVPLELPARGRQCISADEVLGSFYDANYAYRFGPPHHDVVIVSLLDADRRIISDASYFVRRRESIMASATINTEVRQTSPTECQLTIESDRFLHDVRLRIGGFRPDDNDFHLPPQRKKVVRLIATGTRPSVLRGEIEALNLETPTSVSLILNRDEQ
ncbi:glycoside hydrolase family 2 protein [Schlesneria paludicola]|uniref:glycoside hydrolase family 2 protein n=1 Tax=Schlesneria paludicola TaxID=360056 RepID=UPI00029A2CB6|nr:glycoside hydrolase family 2 protein [Schlesneria paludicola]